MSLQSGFTDTLSPGTTSTNTSRRSTSTVRSRTRRFVPFTDDDDDENGRQLQSTGLSAMSSRDPSTIRSRGTTPSPFPSRGVSPIPKSHPSRATQSPGRNGLNSSLGGFYPSGKGQVNFADSSRAAVDFLDSSWSSLQSLASSVLGSDIARAATNGSARTHARKPSRPDPYMRAASRTAVPAAWGPSAPSGPEIGVGTKEERQALAQAKKREALLLADTAEPGNPSTRHKRRDSSDQTDHSAIDPEQDEEALAYIHHVLATDSITGVTIRYGCQPAIFRKANGFWPMDSIQGRKTVLLPVDSCSVKGRPVSPPGRVNNLLDDEEARRKSLEDPNGSSIAPVSGPDSPRPFEDNKTLDAPEEAEGDRLWKHESWVQIDGFPAPVEIGRVPRRALGFFPRTRRKSVSYTDSGSPSVSGSARDRTATPSSSSSPVEPAWSPAISTRPHADSSASRGSSNYKPKHRHQRQRSNMQLSAPGVGTLDRDVMAPGPAQDGLSKWFAQHLPNLAPTPAPPDFESTSENASTANSNTPTTSLDNIGGAVEGWVRKMTTRAKASFNELQQDASSPAGSGLGPGINRRGTGDLIELNDGLESRSNSGLLGETRLRPEFNRSGSSLHTGASVRERFPSPAKGTSGTRSFGDRHKDD
ncbi:hypothetical protein N8T08_008040 [Aspergillus melleus]|uniref:Uncharacterized protein n=1 Tax=Aspergillus melleus TaxID=138277 RepID=A0ACC3AX81_9EURO|nr:hypothetical protein N8T08_008040 [Aspergillus melleus]